MNVSRIALLSVLFTASSVFSMDNATPAPGFFSEVIKLAKAPFVFAADYTIDVTDLVVNWAVNPLFLNQLTKISYLQGGKFQDYVNNNYLGRTMVLVAAAYAAYQLQQAYNAQDVNADEDIFGDDEYATDSN